MRAPTMYSLESYEPAIINDPDERKKVENNLRRVLTSTKESPKNFNVNLLNRLNLNNQLTINNNIINKNQIYNNVNTPFSIKLPTANNQRVFPLLINNIQNNQIFANIKNKNLINHNYTAIQYNNPLSSNYKYNQLLYRNNNMTIYRNPNQNILSIMGIPKKTKNIQYYPYTSVNNFHPNNIYNYNYKKPFYTRKILYANRK